MEKSKRPVYQFILVHEGDNTWFANCPDIEGAFTQGKGLDQVMMRAYDAVCVVKDWDDTSLFDLQFFMNCAPVISREDIPLEDESPDDE